MLRRTFGLALAACLFVGAAAQASDIRVVSSGGFAAALKELAPEFERATGNKLILGWGPSMGETASAVPQRLARGEPIDVLIMVGYALDDLAKEGKVEPDSRFALARSGIGLVVKAGAPRPDISTVEGLKRALLAAKSMAYSDSASGVYIQNEMFKRLGIEDHVKGKARVNYRNTRRGGGGTRGSGDRFPANQRAEADRGHRSGRAAAATGAAVHGVLGGGGERRPTARRGTRADPVSCLSDGRTGDP